jgi:hypothetical protein
MLLDGHLELRAGLAHVERMVPSDVALWAGKAGATRRRLLGAVVGLAQERQSLEVEEPYEHLGPLVGLSSRLAPSRLVSSRLAPSRWAPLRSPLRRSKEASAKR